MRGFWFVASTAFRVIWQGTWQAHSLRLITGVSARSLGMTDVGFPLACRGLRIPGVS
jgi:hypothetical protein